MSEAVNIPPDWQLPAGFYFTQSNLQDFVDCQRRFYLRYIEQQAWPSPLAEPQDAVEQALQRGARFHQLVERHQRGLDLATLQRSLPADSPLLDWLGHYQQALDDLGPFSQRWVETALSTRVGDDPVLAKFDFIGLREATLTGIDWKTGRLPPIPVLQKRWQTIVYLLVLFREGARLAGQPVETFELVYVGVQDGQRLRFAVDAAQAEGYARQVAAVIEEVRAARDFPLVEDERVCRFCAYRGLCERGLSPVVDTPDRFDPDELWLDLDADVPDYEF